MVYVPPIPDPAHPHRPTHPDFALLSALMQDFDGDITGSPRYPGDAMEFARELGIDVDSLEYLLMSQSVVSSARSHKERVLVASSMLTGFAIGTEFWRLRDLAGGDASVALARLLYERGIE